MRCAGLVLLIAIGCGGGTQSAPPSRSPSPPPPASKVEQPTAGQPVAVATSQPLPCTEYTVKCALETMDQFAATMCRCTDRGCAENVHADMQKWGDEMARRGDEMSKTATDDDKKRSVAVMRQYADCMIKLMEPEAPPSDPCGG